MHLGVIGYGTIGQALCERLGTALERPLDRLTLLVRPGTEARAAGAGREVTGDLAAFLAARPDLVIECAGHGAVAAHVPGCLGAGIDTVIASVGALADTALFDAVTAAAQASGARATIAPGAIGGIDLLSALRPGGIDSVLYEGRKPPGAWAGSAAEETVDLASLSTATVFFEGSAREAALKFPRNANVAATVAFAGLGLDATQVTLIADPAAGGNQHRVRVTAAAADYDIRIEGRAAPGNPRTSAATVLSLVREVRNRQGPLAI